MQTNPESAAVEAVAWLGPLGQLIKNDRFQARVNGLPDHGDLSTYTALYPQSALDALRGEVAAAERRVAECLPYLRTFLSQCEKEHTARCDEAGLRELIAALTKVTP